MTALPASFSFDQATRHLRLDPHDPTFFQDPYPAYAAMHEAGGAVFWEQFGLWCFPGYDDVNRLLRDRRLGRERPGGYMASVLAGGDRSHLAAFDAAERGSLLEVEPPVHTRLRALVNRAFVSRQIERLRPQIEALARGLTDRMRKAGGGELIADYATPLPATVIAGMMGLPVETGPQLVAWSNDMVRMYMHQPTREVAERANRSAGEFSEFIRKHAARRRAEPGDDLLSVLVSANADGERLSEEELVSSAILLLNAGHEATVHQTGNAVRAIFAEGGDPMRFFADDATTAATVEECLRHDAPLHMFTRHIYQEVEAGGVTLRPGDEIGLLLAAANRDPTTFMAPEQFRPGRPDQKTAAFGAGIHFCIGAPLARLELQVALHTLFEQLPQLKLVGEPRYRDTYHFHGLERLDYAC